MYEKYRQKLYFNWTFTLLAMLITTLLAFGIFKISQSNNSNISLIYILSLIIVSRYTDGYRYGFVFTVFSVVFINYFFTYPFLYECKEFASAGELMGLQFKTGK